MALRSSNPALARTGWGSPSTPTPDELERLYATPERMTVDDVIVHTLGLFVLLGVAAAAGWAVGPDHGGIGLTAGLTALALSFVIGFSRATKPALIALFAVLEGFFVGAISHLYESAYSGIVAQALSARALPLRLSGGRGSRRASPRTRR